MKKFAAVIALVLLVTGLAFAKKPLPDSAYKTATLISTEEVITGQNCSNYRGLLGVTTDCSARRKLRYHILVDNKLEYVITEDLWDVLHGALPDTEVKYRIEGDKFWIVGVDPISHKLSECKYFIRTVNKAKAESVESAKN